MQELYDYIFDVIVLPAGLEFLEPIIFLFFVSLGTILAFSIFKAIIDRI